MLLSFVIPCYKSENTIQMVVDEIIDTMSVRQKNTYEIILVNDASPDQVFSVLKTMAAQNPNIKVLSLAKNVGKAGAVLAGLSRINGEIVVFLDDDGQCPVNELWKLVDALENGYDIAIADYPQKKQSRFKNAGSYINKKLLQLLIGQPKEINFCNFNARKRFICDEMVKYHNPYPNLQALTLQASHNIIMVPMEERERRDGKSGFTFIKSFSTLINGCTGFSVKPLRISSFLGIIFSIIGFLMGFWVILHKIINPSIQAGYSSIMATILFIGGILMVLLGIIGEYLGRIYVCINNSPQYVIREEINTDIQKD